MSELHSSIDLPYSIDKLWSVLPDLNKYDEWMTIHTGFKGDVPAIEDIKVGTKFSEIVTLMGMANTVEWTVQEFTRPTRCCRPSGVPSSWAAPAWRGSRPSSSPASKRSTPTTPA
ncbi:hypothetical protein I540_2362 [Mycobacteroides abscessus subsp. bolletii 1513]|uniref:SRPBCC family protein n=1 Tax=Mycobacteroides abscessus subsp. bolletii 1513 TaxID=1299321 RepID=X8DPM9_9MYCO|nr:hypothetical protein I540_2362 [Mycobacteroides abscessus subsp. bolletii 1513]